ncbi:MAG: ADP-glyceromanno-heptose 6-epimerase [Candidatus Kaelpia aquatica]|nr:ADP-glyceromanno-heptose 6-epimerase [Candidatus Kaelpia aquatica]
MRDKIIVTGGCGFIGSGIVWALNKKGLEDIIIVDELGENEGQKNLANLKFDELIDKRDFLARILSNNFGSSNIDTIFHLGACSSTTEKDLGYLIENNYNYSRDLASFALRNEIRFIYASSAATYGDGSLGFSDNEEDLFGLKPLNYYGYSKQWFDIWAKHNKVLEKMVGLKYFNVYGPNEYHKGQMRSFIIKAYEQIKERGEVRLFKSYKDEVIDGEQMRDFIYLKDAVKMSLFFFENRYLGGIYNIGTGEAHSFNQLVEAVFRALNLEPDIKYVDMPQELKEQYQYFTQADTSKINSAGYSGECCDFDSAVLDYVKNYLESKAYLSI